jgi:hypothetical protein
MTRNEVKLLSIEIAANSELSPVTRIDGPVSTDKSEYNYK